MSRPTCSTISAEYISRSSISRASSFDLAFSSADRIRLGITAPKEVPVHRQEVLSRLHVARRRFRVVGCESVEGVLETAEQNQVSVVVMDRTLRGCDSIHLIPRLREFNRGLQVIILSGLGYRDSVEQALAAGANEYLVKPCAFDLSVAVDRACTSPVR